MGRTVGELQRSMTQSEYLAWIDFYNDHPFDDLHRYHRPAAAVASAMGGQADKVLAWLAPEPVPEGWNDADASTLRAFGMKPAAKTTTRGKP